MSKCEKLHKVVDNRGRVTYDSHFYIAGICVTHMTPATLSFLEVTYPYYQNKDYEKSKKLSFSLNSREG